MLGFDDRLAAADFACIVAGTGLLVAPELFGLSAISSAVGGTLVLVGAGLFSANLLLVIRNHSPDSVVDVLVGPRLGGSATDTEQAPPIDSD
ncbi:MAG: hypothetical protein V5A38_06480 [Halolamina sp.]|uniref:hypothetical protein n=1 Tax=Halolamina sp. TaxID=1940283 RepID=UPI002FC38FA3